jgi:hypothetical protein
MGGDVAVIRIDNLGYVLEGEEVELEELHAEDQGKVVVKVEL